MRKIIVIFAVLFISMFIASYLFGFYFDRRDFGQGKNMIFGVSFRQNYAKYLGVDVHQTALAIFDDLKVKHIRLIISWNEIESESGKFDFSFFDWFIKEAESRKVKLIVNIGSRVAGWPEFHFPQWALGLLEKERKDRTFLMEKTIVNRYKDSNAVEMWQIENEPLFNWKQLKEVEKILGTQLKVPDKEFLQEQVNLVKKLDKRPIIITDSGELSDWQAASGIGDYFGTTLYRFVWQRIYGDFGFRLYYWYLPPFTWISPVYYYNKAEKLGLDLNKVFIAELQAEPWIRHEPLIKSTIDLQTKIFGVRQFENNIKYARRTGFPRAYLWGAEWWYYLKVNGNPQIWDKARKLWQ